jgi:hypothetical protein
VTAGEVNAAKANGDAHVMLIVHGITVDVTAPASPVAKGGLIRVFDPWRPRPSELIELRYTWRPASIRAR